ncbi:hypothetical protein J41TS12_46020 [Paenibacillus antibioticophila]|uniref:Thioester reductase (TE) domain-containing protein n=1 Tax=Paenibacillus antibioticophila TaxID=1274374 RepID=A0A919XUV9_9BACL|nr:SDR family oxidoreductase [Paenibacillus antibioticophila]GIO39741.1 hypothetical protein J41TS12_46020 [Paenibacillus antibioticophila]
MGILLMDRIIRDYWLYDLQPPMSGLDLYTDYPRDDSRRDMQQIQYPLELDQTYLSREIKTFDSRLWMLACYYIFLYRMSGKAWRIVGVKHEKGYVLPLRIRCDASMSFMELYQSLLNKQEALDFAALPLEEIEEAVGCTGLIHTIFGRDHTCQSSCLNWVVEPLNGGEWTLQVSYRKQLFKPSTIHRFASFFGCIVKAAMYDSRVTIGAIPLVIEEEMEFKGQVQRVRNSEAQMIGLTENPAEFGSPVMRKKAAGCKQKYILLTGATGYLGASVLRELLRTTQAKIYCLVRSEEDDDPYARIARVMKQFFGADIISELLGRVIAVKGDLERPQLGLNSCLTERVSMRIDSIIICGIQECYADDPEYYNRVNVTSTEHLLSWARGRNVRVHYLSSMGVPEGLAERELAAGMHEAGQNKSTKLDHPYYDSKLRAERMLIEACEQEEIAVTIYRLGHLSGDAETGAFPQNVNNSLLYRMLRMIIVQGKAPELDHLLDLTPVSYAAQAIAALAMRRDTAGHLFHLCNPVQISMAELVESLGSCGYPIEVLSDSAYESWLLEYSQVDSSHQRGGDLLHFEWEELRREPFRYSCLHTQEFLEESQVECPVLNTNYLRLMIKYGVDAEYFPARKSDHN